MIGLGSNKNQNKTHFEEGSRSLSYQSKGPVPLSNQMNFSKRQLGPTPHSTWFPIFGNHEQTCISYYLVLVPPCIYWTISIINNLQHNISNFFFFFWGGGGWRPFGIYPKIHSIWRSRPSLNHQYVKIMIRPVSDENIMQASPPPESGLSSWTVPSLSRFWTHPLSWLSRQASLHTRPNLWNSEWRVIPWLWRWCCPGQTQYYYQ